MRVVQINATYGVSSTGKLCRDIHLGLMKNADESYVFTPLISDRFNAEPSVIKVGNKIDRYCHAVLRRMLKNQGFNSILTTRTICQKLENIRPDVVHLHNLHSNYINMDILLSFLRDRNIPTLITLHDTWFFTGYCTHYLGYNCDRWSVGECTGCPAVGKLFQGRVETQYRLKKKLLESIPVLFVNGVSKWTSEDAKKSFLKCAKDISYIYNWTTPVFDGLLSKDAVCRKFHLDPSKKLIIGVAQSWVNGESKGISEFIRIAEKLRNTAEVLLIGERDRQCTTEGITFAGYIRDDLLLNSIYEAADVFVNPSRRETFGLTTAESLAHGTPVVAYNNTGSRELVSADCGILVEDGDCEQMIVSVQNMILQDKQQYSDNCRRRYLQNFEKETQLSKYYALYKQMINTRDILNEQN